MQPFCSAPVVCLTVDLCLICSSLSWYNCPISVFSGDGDDDEEGRGDRLPSCYDYVMHFLTVFWKVLFACVPPTEYWNGWACFLVSISIIGFLTAVIGDLASHFGCTVGLRDTVTAVVFVALGTSVPGAWEENRLYKVIKSFYATTTVVADVWKFYTVLSTSFSCLRHIC